MIYKKGGILNIHFPLFIFPFLVSNRYKPRGLGQSPFRLFDSLAFNVYNILSSGLFVNQRSELYYDKL